MRIEEFVGELKTRVSIIIVTHNMQQAMPGCRILRLPSHGGRQGRRGSVEASATTISSTPRATRGRLTTSTAGSAD